MEQYDNRLGRIIKRMSKLKHRRIEFFSIDREQKNLEKEEKEMKESAKKLQELYFHHSKMSRKQFLRRSESIKERMADIEREKALFAGRTKMHDEVKKETLENIRKKLREKGKLTKIRKALSKKGKLAKIYKRVGKQKKK